MNVLFDMVHPADVHFFKHAINRLRSEGHNVHVTSRYKDVTTNLLDSLSIPHKPISHKGKGAVGLFMELLIRDFRLLIEAIRFNPDILLANNSPSASHIGWLLNKPNIVFDDTEIHTRNRQLYLPFVTNVYTPTSFRAPIGKKQIEVSSYHALAYLHPDHFTPDPGVLKQNGLSSSEPFVFLRFVSWGAMHDIGLHQLTPQQKKDLVDLISPHARVIISSEGELDAALKPYQLDLPIDKIHHFLAFASFVIGESATICCEASVLGTYSILIDDEGRGYTDELEEKFQICRRFTAESYTSLLAHLRGALDNLELTKKTAKEHKARMLESLVNYSDFQINLIEKLARRN